MKINFRLKEIRKKNDLTQNELASLMNVSQAQISRWENLTNYPDIDQLKAFAILFNVSSDYLIGLVD